MAAASSAITPHEALAVVGLHVGRVDQGLDRGANIAQRRAIAIGQRLQRLIALGLALEVAGDVLDGQHVAGDLQPGASVLSQSHLP